MKNYFSEISFTFIFIIVSDIGEVIDLVFAIEGTRRMKEDGFTEAKEFIKNMVQSNYTISKDGTHVGIVEYSEEPSIKLRLDETFDEDVIQNVIKNMTPSAGENANLDEALDKSINKMFSVSMGGRPSAKKILVVIAASNTTGKEALKKSSKPLKERGVRVYVVSLGSDPETLAVLLPDETKLPKNTPSSALPEFSKELQEIIRKDVSESKLL